MPVRIQPINLQTSTILWRPSCGYSLRKECSRRIDDACARRHSLRRGPRFRGYNRELYLRSEALSQLRPSWAHRLQTFFPCLTTSSSASMESKPRPSGPKSGKSSPICSGATCSIRFLTSISLIWARKIVLRHKRAAILLQITHRVKRLGSGRVCLVPLKLVGFVSGSDCLSWIRAHFRRGRLVFDPRHSRLRRFHIGFWRLRSQTFRPCGVRR